MEKRTLIFRSEITLGDPNVVLGFVPYGKLSSPIVGPGKTFREVLEPFCFAHSIMQNRIFSLYEHNPSFELGNTVEGSLQLREKSDGIRFRLKLEPGEFNHSIIDSVAEGALNGVSPGFYVNKDKWSPDGKRRSVIDADLLEISLCKLPVYPQTAACMKPPPDERKVQPIRTPKVRFGGSAVPFSLEEKAKFRFREPKRR